MDREKSTSRSATKRDQSDAWGDLTISNTEQHKVCMGILFSIFIHVEVWSVHGIYVLLYWTCIAIGWRDGVCYCFVRLHVANKATGLFIFTGLLYNINNLRKLLHTFVCVSTSEVGYCVATEISTSEVGHCVATETNRFVSWPPQLKQLLMCMVHVTACWTDTRNRRVSTEKQTQRRPHICSSCGSTYSKQNPIEGEK